LFAVDGTMNECGDVPARYFRRLRGTACARLALLLLAAGPACQPPSRLRSPERFANGIVFVLPGIEGRSIWNRNIAVGLDRGGVDAAIEVYDWTIGLPAVYNLIDIYRNRREARKLAGRIVEHRLRYPVSPVHLIGHSGGGGIAVLTLEALPAGCEIDMAILLAPALSPNYDLTAALARTRYGICNFYSHYDIGFLTVGTTVFGSVDRDLGPSAGAVGFREPPGLSAMGRELYARRLRQVAWTPELAGLGASGSHFGWASEQFAAQYLAPLIRQNRLLVQPRGGSRLRRRKNVVRASRPCFCGMEARPAR
jgi:pimeloyl-ACP methyl ester carboxylesterase